jgi:hypothetical protein
MQPVLWNDSRFRKTAAHIVVSGGWSKDGYHPSVGRPVVDWEIYGSWSGADANTGTIVMGPLEVKSGQQVCLPIVRGPDLGGLAILLTDSETGDVLASMSLPPSAQWSLQCASVESGNGAPRRLVVTAKDDGEKWGEWLGVGVPAVLDLAEKQKQ